MSLTKKQKRNIDKIIGVVFYAIFLPFVLLYTISYLINISVKYLFERFLIPLYNKVCILVRRPIPNSTVQVKGKDDKHFHRINEKLLTIKEAKSLGQQYEEKGYEVHLNLSEF